MAAAQHPNPGSRDGWMSAKVNTKSRRHAIAFLPLRERRSIRAGTRLHENVATKEQCSVVCANTPQTKRGAPVTVFPPKSVVLSLHFLNRQPGSLRRVHPSAFRQHRDESVLSGSLRILLPCLITWHCCGRKPCARHTALLLLSTEPPKEFHRESARTLAENRGRNSFGPP